MAEEAKTTEETKATEKVETPEINPEVEELKAQVEKQKAETARFKAAVDKLTKEAAEKKREERAKMSEDERTKAEQSEELERAKAEREAAASELNHLKAVIAYKDLADEQTAEKLIDAVNDKDHAAIANLIKLECERAVKAKEAEWKKTRPDAFVGGATPMTKEQIMAIKDDEERIRQIALHKDLF